MIFFWIGALTYLYTRGQSSSPWVPPLRGKFKVNFDGASFGNLGPTGYGCVVCDYQGSIVIAKGGPIGTADAIEAELMGLLVALCILKEKNLLECFME